MPSTVIDLKQTVTLGEKTIETVGHFEFDRDWLLATMVIAAIDMFCAARDKDRPAE